MELWDLYDKYRNKIGKTHVKGTRTQKGEYHIAVRLWIVNSKDQLLIQRRQLDNITWAGMWEAAAAGSAITGDSSYEAVIRETREEIGLDISNDLLEPLFTVQFKNGFDDNYLLRRDVNIERLILQEEEVVDIKWATMDEIREMVKMEQFIPFPFLEKVFYIINSHIRLIKATVDDKEELLDLQKTIFKTLLLKYEDYNFSPATQTIERFEKRFDIGDYYKIICNDTLIGSIFVFQKLPGIMRLHIMNILEEYQNKGIAQEVISRIETLYPQAEKWELQTILTEAGNCHLYEKMGYVQTGETRTINDKLILVDYVKDKDILRVEDIVDLKNK